MENDHTEVRRQDRGGGGAELRRPAGPASGAGAGRLKRLLLRVLTYRRAEALKTWLAGLLYYSGLAWLAGRLRSRGAAILMYHSIGARGAFQDNVISARQFESHLAWLARRFKIVPMAALLERLETGGEVPDDWAVLTFDDGYRDNFETALPLLRKYGAAASFFPTVDVVDRGKRFFYDSIQGIVAASSRRELSVELDGRPALFRTDGEERRNDAALRMVLAVRGRDSAERLAFVDALRKSAGVEREPAGALYLRPGDLKALAEAGMEIGSHTLSHPNLAVLKNGELEEEINQSKSRLEAMTGARLEGFAYPFGKRPHVGAAAEAVRRAGYRYALTTEFGRAAPGCGLFALPRIGVRGPLVRLKVNLLGIPL